MAIRQRHTKAEIAAKLDLADEMASQGKQHRDIARSLNVSLMTYYRWRKLRTTPVHAAPQPLRDAGQTAIVTERNSAEHVSPVEHEQSQIRDLQRENSRLRHLVTDLLLEKLELEERLSSGRVRMDGRT